jgi:hypothetical protein
MAGITINALPTVAAAEFTDVVPIETAGGVTSQESWQQVATLFSQQLLPIAGGTMTGPLILSEDPVTNLQAATKEYVDNFASGIAIILACQLGTIGANLNATYANGSSGVGATLTNAGTQVAFSLDGVTPSVGARILVKDQTTAFQGGVYTLTNAGSGATNWVLTRATDYDTPAQILPGTVVVVNQGTVNTATSWIQTATVTTVGTSAILFSPFSQSPSNFLKVANNLSDVASVSASRTNLGLGTAATKAASSNAQATVASVSGTFTTGHVAVFADTAGTIQDAGASTGTGSPVFSTSPTLVTPTLGAATATSLTFSPTTGGIVGTTTNDNADAGKVGEYISSQVLFANRFNVSQNVPVTVTQVNLTAGDWDVSGNVFFFVAGGSSGTFSGGYSAISLISATMPDQSLFSGPNAVNGSVFPTLGNAVSTQRVSLAAPATVYLVTIAGTFGPGGPTVSVSGFIGARRMR